MSLAPSSIPDYRWPEEFLALGAAPKRWLGAIIFHLCRLAGMIRWLFSRKKAAVLVIRTDGVGDAILFEPALRSLGARFPGHRLHFWAPAATCDLFRGYPYLEQLVPILRGAKAGNLAYFNSLSCRARMGWLMGRYAFDVAVYPAESPEPMGNWLLCSVRARERWYNPGDCENQFAQQQARTAAVATLLLENRPGGGHELLRNAHLASQWGQKIEGEAVRIYRTYDADCAVEGQIAAWLEEADGLGARAIVGVVPGASMAVNAYPLAMWRDAIAQLWQEHGVLCGLIGGPADATTIDELSKLLADVPHLRMTHTVDMLALAALIQRLDTLISLDTAAAHLALSLSIPTIVIRGGGHPGRFFPWPNGQQAVLNHPMPCDGCLCRCQLPEAQCITRITPAQIVDAFVKLRRPSDRRLTVPDQAELRRAV